MKQRVAAPPIKSLPVEIPVFPLDGALLLPGGKLPLNIFEDRYLNMVRDVLSMDVRAFGMIQTLDRQGDGGPARGPHVPLHGVGCLGRLTNFEETPDGRFLITLDGLIRFRVVRELEMRHGYRRVEASYGEFGGDVEFAAVTVDRDRLLEALRGYFKIKGITADWQVIGKCDCEKLVTTLSMVCPLGHSDKQALLEAPDTLKRADILTSLLEMETAGHATDNKGSGHAVH